MTEKEFLELLEPLEGYLIRMATAIVGDREEARDCLQEAVLSAFAARNQLRDNSSFKPWIKRIVVHECGKHLKKRGSVIPMGSGLEYVFEGKPSNSDFDNKLIWIVVNTLPLHLTQVIVLKYLVDMRQKEIADVLGIPEGTVKSRINKALNLLREELHGKGVGSDEM